MSASTEVLHPLTAPRRATRHLFIQTPSDGVLSVKVRRVERWHCVGVVSLPRRSSHLPDAGCH